MAPPRRRHYDYVRLLPYAIIIFIFIAFLRLRRHEIRFRLMPAFVCCRLIFAMSYR